MPERIETQNRADRYAKADAERFDGKPRTNKLKDANLAIAGASEAWARDFAERFTAALPQLEPGRRHWLVGVKIERVKPGLATADNPLMLRLKVWNGGKGADDKRRWVYVPLGSDAEPVALAVVTAAKMETQPAKREGRWVVEVVN